MIIEDANGHVAHYGVKGMKWGVRKSRGSPPKMDLKNIPKMDLKTMTKYNAQGKRAVTKYARKNPESIVTIHKRRRDIVMSGREFTEMLSSEHRTIRYRDITARRGRR